VTNQVQVVDSQVLAVDNPVVAISQEAVEDNLAEVINQVVDSQVVNQAEINQQVQVEISQQAQVVTNQQVQVATNHHYPIQIIQVLTLVSN